MRVPGLKTLKRSARWLRSRFVKGALILGYHRVAEVPHDPYGICVTPRHFAEQLETLHQRANPMSLRQLVQALHSGNLPRRAVVLTFDDGYADVFHHVKPLLERYQTPATFFMTTGYIGREFWWDELERILFLPTKLPDQLCLEVEGAIYRWTSDNIGESRLKPKALDHRRRLLSSLYEWLLPLTPVQIEGALEQLWGWTGAASNDQPHSRAMTADELVELAAGSSVDIGAHSVTHPRLLQLSLAAQRLEIQQSKAYLEELLGRPVTSFSYPNGSFSTATRTIVRDSGFVCACASHSDVASGANDRFCLPRFWIPDWDGAKFSRWLEQWL